MADSPKQIAAMNTHHSASEGGKVESVSICHLAEMQTSK